MICLAACVHTGVDLPVSLQGFLCLELGTTLVTNYGLLTSCTTDKQETKASTFNTHSHTCVTFGKAVRNREREGNKIHGESRGNTDTEPFLNFILHSVLSLKF